MRYILILIGLLSAAPVAAQDLSALARLDPENSAISQNGDGVDVQLTLSQPVPWRLRFLDAPPRLILDFREVDWARLSEVAIDQDAVTGLRAGVFRPGWSRLVVELAGPMKVVRSAMTTRAGAVVQVALQPTDAADFAQTAALPEPPEWQLPKSADLPPPVSGAGPMVVVLDPGHGGLDPGAQRDGYNEADLVLTFAREFKELLVRQGGFSVVLTRDRDEFVPLEQRISIARAAGAQLFLSLHADSVTEGDAVGATVYSLSDAASDKASQTLAERHDRDDLLAGVDLSAQDDLVAQVLMDMARRSTTPRTARLSHALAQSIQAAGITMHRHPEQGAGFSVLKSPDIPSVLVELGFLSSAKDLAQLRDPNWRNQMAAALRDGLLTWAQQDRALQSLPMQ